MRLTAEQSKILLRAKFSPFGVDGYDAAMMQQLVEAGLMTPHHSRFTSTWRITDAGLATIEPGMEMVVDRGRDAGLEGR
jgi:hypothetical protein